MAYGDLKCRNLIWNSGSGDNTVVLSTLATQSYVTTNFAPKSNPTFAGTINGADLVLSGNLTVSGTQTIINTNVLQVEDKHIEIGKVSSPSDTTADGGGIILKASSDRTFVWINSTDAWTSSEHIQVASGKTFIGDGSTLTALNATNLASGTVPTARLGTGTAGSSNFLRGDGSWQAIATDKIEEGNTSVETIDTGSDGHVKITTEGTERARFDNLGNLSVGGTSPSTQSAKLQAYGTSQNGTRINMHHEGNSSASISANGGLVLSADGANGTTERFRVGTSGQLGVGGATYGSSGQVLTSGGASAAPSWTTISAAPEITATASGAIAANKAVIVNSNGTISEVGEVTSPSALTEIGEALNTTSEHVDPDDVVWINDNTFIATWQAWNDSNKAYVIAGTISGSTVTLGTKVALNTNNDPTKALQLAVDRTNETFLVVGYVAAGSDRFVRGGRISSGTTISMGTSDGLYNPTADSTCVASDDNGNFMIACYNSAAGAYKFENVVVNANNSITHSSQAEFTALYPISNSAQYASISYDKNQGKYFFVGVNNSNDLKGCWVTSNGSSSAPTVTATNFSIADSVYPDLSWDSNGSQFILTQRKHDGSNWKPYAVVLTPSGTNAPSIGTQFLMEDIITSNVKSTYITACKKVAVIRSGTSSIKIQVLNISGTTLSSYSTTTIDNLDRGAIAIHSHETANRIVSVFRDDSDTYSARFEVWDVPAVTTNLTSENFIGFAPSAISNSASGTVAVTGNTSTQSGLTAGQKYHLQQNGTLSTTSVSTSVEAGIALSSTKLLIKG